MLKMEKTFNFIFRFLIWKIFMMLLKSEMAEDQIPYF